MKVRHDEEPTSTYIAWCVLAGSLFSAAAVAANDVALALVLLAMLAAAVSLEAVLP